MVSSLGLSCTATTNALVFASLVPKNSSSSLPPTIHNQENKPRGVNKIRNATHKSNTTPKKQPSVTEMERAIGAGIFRDNDPSGAGEKQTLFDMISSTPANYPESKVEKKLRETGEWILDATKGPTPSAGHDILMSICLGILPIWLLFLLIAFGGFKLPFSTPALDDLIM